MANKISSNLFNLDPEQQKILKESQERYIAAQDEYFFDHYQAAHGSYNFFGTKIIVFPHNQKLTWTKSASTFNTIFFQRFNKGSLTDRSREIGVKVCDRLMTLLDEADQKLQKEANCITRLFHKIFSYFSSRETILKTELASLKEFLGAYTAEQFKKKTDEDPTDDLFAFSLDETRYYRLPNQ